MTIKKDLTTVNFTSKTSRDIKGIVLHSMAGTQSGSIAWFKNPDAKASAHYCISKTGSIVQCVLDKDIAWHAGIFDEPIADWLKPNPNNVTIGIELEDEGNRDWIYPEAQIKSLKELINKLCSDYSIPQDAGHILLHRNLNPSRRSDPVGNFDLNWVLSNAQPENILLKLLEENGIDTEGELREVIGHHNDYPTLVSDKENCNKELNALKEQLRTKDAVLEELNKDVKALKVQTEELRKQYDDFLNKLIKKLNPLETGNDEATVLGEIDRLISTEDGSDDIKKKLTDALKTIDELNQKLAEKKEVVNYKALPTIGQIFKLVLLKMARR